MPRFALLDADDRVVNVVALARREDFLTTVSHGEGDTAEPVLIDSDHHLAGHGAVDLVEVGLKVRPGMVRTGNAFGWPAPVAEPPTPAPAATPAAAQ